MRHVTLIAAALIGVAGCATPSVRPPLTSIPTYTTGPADGSGWSTQPLDQPRPWPSMFWNWSSDHDRGVCQWLTPDLLKGFGWTGEKMNIEGPPCVIPVANGNVLQIHLGNVYTSFSDPGFDTTAFMRSITIARLEAREWDLEASQDKYPGSCQVSVNTRSLSNLTVLVGTPPGSSAETATLRQCAWARRIATLIVRKYVPLAGGTPWPRTPQSVSPQALARLEEIAGRRLNACDLLKESAVVVGFLGDAPGQPGNEGDGTTCTFARDKIRASAWHATDRPAAWRETLPPLAQGELTASGTLGIMPAHIQLTRAGTQCGEAVEYVPGRVLRVSYQNPRFSAETLCRITEEMIGNLLGRFMDSLAS